MEILIGADPEVFVKSGGVNVSGHDMIPGTKRRPYKVEKGAVQVDGTALEFNINPAATAEEFVANVRTVLDTLKSMIPKDCELDISAVARYEQAYFDSLPVAVKAMGCDPDFNAYTGVEIERKGQETSMRTAAGHVHIGWTTDADPFKAQHYQSCRTLARELDLWLGVPSVLFDPESGPRRALYGQAGAFRPKPYGCEYRVLSNKWLQSEELMKWVFGQTTRCFAHLMSGKGPYSNYIGHQNTQKAINDSDVDMANRILISLSSPELLMPDGSSFAKKKKVDQSIAPVSEVQWKQIYEAAAAGVAPPMPARPRAPRVRPAEVDDEE